jgi:predicted aldo/keto reductase-like oxidoreductase
LVLFLPQLQPGASSACRCARLDQIARFSNLVEQRPARRAPSSRHAHAARMPSSSRRDFLTAAATLLAAMQAQGVTGKGQGSGAGAVPRRPLGRTGEQVSMLGLGGYHLGVPPEAEALRIVRTAIDHGLDFLDNCWDYNGGASEARMGKALRDGYRARAFLMTKLDGRTARAAREQLEQSLRRLQTDRIDLVQIHEVIRPEDPQRCFAQGGAIEALVEARQAGKLRYIGFTGHKAPQLHLAMLQEARRHGFRFDAVQMPLNVLDAHYRSFEHEVLPELTKEGVAALGMKSMGAGEVLRAGVASLRECLRYALSLPASVVITGCDSLAILEQALDVARTFAPLSAPQRAELLARTAQVARDGRFEPFKTTQQFDGTAQNPHWLEGAAL